MTQPKFKVGDVVKFTFKNEKLTGIILNRIDGDGHYTDDDIFTIKVIDPPDWEKGCDYGSLSGGGAKKECQVWESALLPAKSAQMSLALTKPTVSGIETDDGTRAFFMQIKKEPSVFCSNCGVVTEPLFIGCKCPRCGWKSHP